MATLSEIREQYLKMLDIIDSAEQAAEGVVEDMDDYLYVLLDDARDELETKLESCAAVRDTLLAGAKQTAEKIRFLQAHKKRLEGNAERLRGWMAINMEAACLNEVQTNLYKMKFAKKPAYAIEMDHVDFIQNIDKIDKSMYKLEDPKPVKREIVKALKGGQDVPGFILIDNEYALRIK
jgi:hypothetical protein